MKNHIIPLDEEIFKVFGFSEEQIIFSSKEHHTFESLLSATAKQGMLESMRTIPVKSLQEIVFNEKDKTFTLKYDNKGKTKKVTVVLKNNDLRESVVVEIAALKQLNKTVIEESKTKPLLLNLLGVIIIPSFTWVFRGMAIDAENGQHYVASGRRRGANQLLADVVEAIGSTGITIIGLLGLILMIYITYKRYNNPASVVKYS